MFWLCLWESGASTYAHAALEISYAGAGTVDTDSTSCGERRGSDAGDVSIMLVVGDDIPDGDTSLLAWGKLALTRCVESSSELGKPHKRPKAETQTKLRQRASDACTPYKRQGRGNRSGSSAERIMTGKIRATGPYGMTDSM
ncbi:hypothetical protein B0I37DRAFT_157895 [Chaetomium sp. MPI-CAGE-AT-0009]|nr:hypothetical protein B0I37DRAFT_157895 [Chaetomium sp. MPI-CAGE-AT-0009]